MGVLVVQQKERRQFDEGEEAFLVTMSAQLAGVIAHAEATGSIRGLGKQGKGIQEAKFVGVAGSPGAAVGTAVVVLPPADLEVVPDKAVEDIDAELGLFNSALEGCAPTCVRFRRRWPRSCVRKSGRCSTST